MRRGSAAPTHVAQITSAWLSSSRSAARRSLLKIFSSSAESSPVSSFSRCSLCSAEFSAAASSFTWWCSVRCSTDEGTVLSRDLAHTRTTLSPVALILSVRWSTAMLEGAHTSVCPPCVRTMWYTIVAEVVVFPVPGGPCMSESGRESACATANCCEWLSSASPGTPSLRGGGFSIVGSSTSCPSSRWYR